MFISYGKQSNDSLLQYYGFVEPGIQHDTYVVPNLAAAAGSAVPSIRLPATKARLSYHLNPFPSCQGFTEPEPSHDIQRVPDLAADAGKRCSSTTLLPQGHALQTPPALPFPLSQDTLRSGWQYPR